MTKGTHEFKAQFLKGGYNLNYFMFNQKTTDVSSKKDNKYSFKLDQNYPDPFNPSTIIRYQIPKQSFVQIKIYDVLGKEVRSLVNQDKNAGEYEVKFDGSNLSSGIYFYRITAGDFVATKKMILTK